MEMYFKDAWSKLRPNVLALAIVFALFFAAMRGFGMLGPQSARPLVPLGFVLMMALPFIFMSREGRRKIGLKNSDSISSYGIGILYGVVAASVCFTIGVMLFGNSYDNWFITIRNYYLNQIPGAADMPPVRFFWIATIPALIFSPIGEEIFFRGFLQDAFQTRFNVKTSIVCESIFFGVVHLCHHGLVRVDNAIKFYPLSGLLWIILMFLTAFGFAMLRKKSGSLFPCILAHAVFNLTMNIYIFSFLLTDFK